MKKKARATQHPPPEAFPPDFLTKSTRLNVVFRSCLLYRAFLGLLIHPIPRCPYPGITPLLQALVTRPDVRALKLFLNDGFRNPNFISIIYKTHVRQMLTSINQLNCGHTANHIRHSGISLSSKIVLLR